MHGLVREDIKSKISKIGFFSTANAERLSNIGSNIFGLSVHYDNAANLNKSKGAIALVRAVNDELISEEQFKKQLSAIEKKKDVILTEVGHNNIWIASKDQKNTHLETYQFNEFLIANNLYRKMFDLISSQANIAA